MNELVNRNPAHTSPDPFDDGLSSRVGGGVVNCLDRNEVEVHGSYTSQDAQRQGFTGSRPLSIRADGDRLDDHDPPEGILVHRDRDPQPSERPLHLCSRNLLDQLPVGGFQWSAESCLCL